ncbi:hypothetical protein UlMin_003482 [Ulmus minor]
MEIKGETVEDRLRVCVTRTYDWGYRKYGGLQKEIVHLQWDIERKKTYESFGHSLGVILEMEKRLDSLQNRNEIYWKQRSRMEWLAHGDHNSKLFHLKATERKKKNMIDGLLDNNSVWHTDPTKLLSIMQGYF